MFLNTQDADTARRALRERAVWASRHGFFWLSERDLRLVERLSITTSLPESDRLHLQSVLMRVGGSENVALAKKLGGLL